MAGGFKAFGPTYNTTPYVRLGIEGNINGLHNVHADDAEIAKGELAGKIAAIGADGLVFSAKGVGAVGLFREDLNDMVNASLKGSFYFRGGEYYVAQSRTAMDDAAFTALALGDQLTTDANGKLLKLTDATTETAVATVVFKGEFRNGNMYEWAGATANGGKFVGFILHI